MCKLLGIEFNSVYLHTIKYLIECLLIIFELFDFQNRVIISCMQYLSSFISAVKWKLVRFTCFFQQQSNSLEINFT